jgi:natural product biosynthesis luciferase-like monooxygenase protein
MSLFYFSGAASAPPGPERYRLLLDGARFADANGFCAVWTPERHFHDFGGLYPAPSVTASAVAAITSNVQIRAGSVVMPLHHPARVAEAWSVVDNISNGRVGISIAAGWQPNDFVLMPQNYTNAKQVMFDNADALRRLWRGETVTFDGPLGPVDVATLPTPVQPEIPLWVTTAGNPETFEQAGRLGANLLTHLLGQSIEQLAPKIEAYRRARAEAGFDPDSGTVSLMLHTFVGDDPDAVREAVREPLKTYLGTSFSLLKEYAWSFPAFARPAGDTGGLSDDDFKGLSDDELDAVLEFAFLRYYETSGLFGPPDRCLDMIDSLREVGVDEIACLIDFGVDTDAVLDSLPLLTTIKDAANAAVPSTGDAEAEIAPARTVEPVESTATQILRHGVTHLQCTPSMARMFTMQDDTRQALASISHMFVGGEGLPVALARDLVEVLGDGTLTNMYGPTETTIWSSTWSVPAGVESISIGTPIANTSLYVLDAHRQPTLPGVPGELWIGGDGVVRGYHDRAELTAERFVSDPFRGAGARMYRTGDLVRWVPDADGGASVEFLGRIDHQVKLRGYRIELGEIEAQLGRCDGVRENVVIVRSDDHGEQQLLAFVSKAPGAQPDATAIRGRLRETLPDVMVPAHVVVLDDLPHTPNGKIDRNSLPALSDVRHRPTGSRVAASNDLERQVLEIWCDVLDNPDVGVDDNFFDVGGHSLLVVRLHRRLKDELDGEPIPLTDLYRFPTVRSFAAARESGDGRATVKAGVDRASRRLDTMRRRRSG